MRKLIARLAVSLGATLAVLVLSGCGGDGDAVDDVVAVEPMGDYSLEGATCPDGFSLADDAPGSASIDFTISEGDDGLGFDTADTVDVACVSDPDGDPFPFEAGEIEFTVSPDGSVSGSATWSDSVGLSMNALISGSAADSLDEISLELTAPNGDTLSNLTFVTSSSPGN